MNKLSFWDKLKAYKIMNNFLVLVMLCLFMVISVIIYLLPSINQNQVLSDIALAFSTSLLASIFCLISDIYIKFKDYKNERFLGDIQSFGIKGLYFNKKQILSELLEDCDKELWISGYRLIMTAGLTEDIADAMSRGADVKALLCPPWLSGYRLMYGESDRIIANYCKVFDTLRDNMKIYGNKCVVRFTEKPLLSDTYKVDQHIISSPFMHNEDKEHGKITANDFFTYDLVKKSRLNTLLTEEYETLFCNAEFELDWEAYDSAREYFLQEYYTEQEKVAMMSRLCIPASGKTEA